MNAFKQIAISLPSFICLTGIFPPIAWLIVVLTFEGVKLAFGYNAPLVGKPNDIPPGAVLVTIIYLTLCAYISRKLYKNKLSICSAIVAIGALIAAKYVYEVTGSIIWF